MKEKRYSMTLSVHTKDKLFESSSSSWTKRIDFEDLGNGEKTALDIVKDCYYSFFKNVRDVTVEELVKSGKYKIKWKKWTVNRIMNHFKKFDIDRSTLEKTKEELDAIEKES